MPVTLLSIFVSLLPQRYRGYWLGDGNLDVRRGAILSAVLQFVLACAAMWALYPAFVRSRYADLSASMAGHPADNIVEGFADFAYGPIVVLAYIFRPLTLVLLYFALEGAVRMVAAVATNEIVPTLPLQLLAIAIATGRAQWQERELGPRIADVVEPAVTGKYDLKILSCRPKEWNRLTTISYNEGMYELQGEETGPPPLRFVYLLRLKPEYKIVRGLHAYDPEEAMRRPGWAEVAEKPRK